MRVAAEMSAPMLGSLLRAAMLSVAFAPHVNLVGTPFIDGEIVCVYARVRSGEQWHVGRVDVRRRKITFSGGEVPISHPRVWVRRSGE
jgi:hypothetical protein